MIRNFFAIFFTILFIASCKTESKKIEILVSVDKRLSDKDFKFIKSNTLNTRFYSVKIEISNNTDTTFNYVSMNCTWQENWISNKNNFILLPEIDCIHNSPDSYLIKPKMKRELHSVLIVNESIEKFNDQNSKLGMVHIQLDEIMKNIDFKDALRYKFENKKDIIWSNQIYLKE